MKIFQFILILLLFISVQLRAEDSKTMPLKSKDWVFVVKDTSINIDRVFKFENNTIYIQGLTMGYLRTKKTYTNFTLSLDWRWTKKLGNSGVLTHIQPKDSIWPVCYQVQQKAGAAGDIICMNGLWAKECTDTVKFTIPKKNESNEKPLNEWNSMRIICKRNSMQVFINGVLQNAITGLTVKKGFIGFQNEGTPMEIRNLCVKKNN